MPVAFPRSDQVDIPTAYEPGTGARDNDKGYRPRETQRCFRSVCVGVWVCAQVIEDYGECVCVSCSRRFRFQQHDSIMD